MTFPETDRERTWAAGVGAAVLALVGGSLLFYDTVYGGFVWHYFWGPVYADAHGAACAAWNGGSPVLLDSAVQCASATEPVAYPGYTLVSEVGYMVTLIVMLSGVVFLLDRLNVGENRRLLFALLPFMFFGGALRVVEDANDALGGSAVPYPWNSFIISPLIYFTVFFLAVGALVLAVWIARRDYTDDYYRPLAAIGSAVLAASLAYLGYLAATTDRVHFLPVFTVLTIGIATVLAVAVYKGADAFAPEINYGTGLAGAVVIWGHAVDGVSNVIGLDWGAELGYPNGDLVPKHPVNSAVVDLTQQYVPQSITAVIGDAWGFLLLKLVAATFVVWLFNDELYEENPRFAVLLLVAVLAVGLGPGTRDMLRATFGI
ncbi:DUF63 family protein [Salarchaeum japonicum]|uniref:DUF63 family protein n=1 Tax=Salarchaeum japonicum TaxID=555573 RepID=A0AAV3SXT9_9EURY|nr:DUF63 family protein [Salarchaeum japonicum]